MGDNPDNDFRTHTVWMPHICEICMKECSQNENLKRYLLTHIGEKPHVYDICYKWFSRNSNFQTHFLKHTDEKPLFSKTCNKGFSWKDDLMRIFEHIQMKWLIFFKYAEKDFHEIAICKGIDNDGIMILIIFMVIGI